MFKKALIPAALTCFSAVISAATYEVMEVPAASLNDSYAENSPFSISDNGVVLGSARDSFNYPFYLDYLRELNSAEGLEACGSSESENTEVDGVVTISSPVAQDGISNKARICATAAEILQTSFVSAEELETGDLDLVSQAFLKASLSITSSVNFQKVGDDKSFRYVLASDSQSESFEFADLADEADAELGELTRSNTEALRAENSSAVAVGTASAPYFPTSFLPQDLELDSADCQERGYSESATCILDDAIDTEITFWQREHRGRAVVYSNGLSQYLDPSPAFNSFGGFSGATDISDSGFVAGYEAVGLTEASEESIAENCDGRLEPVDICSQANAAFVVRPVIWKLNEDKSVQEKTTFDLTFTPTEFNTGNYTSRAVAINEAGIAVGYGSIPISESSSRSLSQPLLFKDGEVTQIPTESFDFDRGYAVDVNDGNLAIGKFENVAFSNNSFIAFEERFFIYDIDTGEVKTPETFYATADSAANSINDAGVVVGEAEYEVTTNNVRRKHGFVYDSVSDNLNDINDLTECGSEYDIVELRSINNSNQIVGTALKTVNVRGADGEDLLDDNGEPSKEQITVTVILNPITGGQIDECPSEQEPNYERQGASTNILVLMLLSALIVIRRRFI